MTDVGSIALALEALKHASTIVTTIRNADTAFEKAELKLKIVELAEALATARLNVLETRNEIQALKEQIERSSEAARGQLVQRGNVYYFQEGEREVGPFCPRCYETEGRRMPLTSLPSVFADLAKYRCPQCEATY